MFHKLLTQYEALEANGVLPFCIAGKDLAAYEEDCDAINAAIKTIQDLIAHFPWRASSLDLLRLNTIRQTYGLYLTMPSEVST